MIRKIHLQNQIGVYSIHNVECKSQVKYQGIYRSKGILLGNPYPSLWDRLLH